MELAPELVERLHAARPEELEELILTIALDLAGASSGALFVEDEKRSGLLMEFHVAEGVRIERPGTFLRKRTDGRPNGIAFWVADHNESYNCRDADADPNYAQYFSPYKSIVGVPMPYQDRAIGVISVASTRLAAFDEHHVAQLAALGRVAARFLHRLQVFREWRKAKGQGLMIKGLSPGWREAERRIERSAPTDLPVLIRGESGTGKELVAHSIHFSSRRRDEPFVIVNSAAIPEALIESTLFGHVKGAFTGATYGKKGEIEKARGGTLFLDEIGELPPALQAKLLRVLESREFSPVGSNEKPKVADIRLICATNRPLERMAAEGGFREDLFFRIGVVTINLPPLRSYLAANLPILLETFVFEASRKHGRGIRGVTDAARAAIAAHDFPGNMREFRNLIDQAVVLCEGDRLDLADLPAAVRESAARAAPDAEAGDAPTGGSTEEERAWLPYAQAKESALLGFQRDYLTRLLDRSGGDVTRAASLADVSVPSIYRLLKQAGIRRHWR